MWTTVLPGALRCDARNQRRDPMVRVKMPTPLLASALVLASTGAALAHHGWEWTEDQESRLSGTIEAISLGNPHAHLTLRNEQGLWEVDLAPPSATARAGFVAGVTAVGDKASVSGH